MALRSSNAVVPTRTPRLSSALAAWKLEVRFALRSQWPLHPSQLGLDVTCRHEFESSRGGLPYAEVESTPACPSIRRNGSGSLHCVSSSINLGLVDFNDRSPSVKQILVSDGVWLSQNNRLFPGYLSSLQLSEPVTVTTELWSRRTPSRPRRYWLSKWSIVPLRSWLSWRLWPTDRAFNASSDACQVSGLSAGAQGRGSFANFSASLCLSGRGARCCMTVRC